MRINGTLPRKIALSLAGLALVVSFLITYDAYRSASAMAGLLWLIYPFWAGTSIVVGFALGWLIGTVLLYVKARRSGLADSEVQFNKPVVYFSILVIVVTVFFGAWSAYQSHLEKLIYSSMTSPQKLDDLSRNLFVIRSPHLKEYLAKNPSTGSDALERLYASDEIQVRSTVCQNPAVSSEVLEHCAMENNIAVLGGVARNPKTPAKVVERLSRHPSYLIRRAIGFRTDIGPEIIDRFSRDEHEEVRGSILYHPQLSSAVLDRLANDPVTMVRVRVAANKKTPLPTLLRLARDPDHNVRWALFRNDAPKQLLDVLVNDPDDRIRQRADYLSGKK